MHARIDGLVVDDGRLTTRHADVRLTMLRGCDAEDGDDDQKVLEGHGREELVRNGDDLRRN